MTTAGPVRILGIVRHHPGTSRSLANRLVALASLLAVAGCGGGDICLNCNPSGSPTPISGVLVTGNISRLSTFNPFSDVTVVICVDLPDGGGVENCPKIFLANVFTNGTFTRSGVDPGSETIYFWIDENGDGQIDPGDPIAQLQDPNGELRLVESGFTVDVANAVVDFTTQTATATISVSATPTPTPTPVTTPTPTPTPAG